MEHEFARLARGHGQGAGPLDRVGHVHFHRQRDRRGGRIVSPDLQRRRAVGRQVAQTVHRHLHGRRVFHQGQHVEAEGILERPVAGNAGLHPTGNVIEGEHGPPLVTGAVGAGQFEVLGRGTQFQFPPASAVGCGARGGKPRLNDELRVPVLERLAQRHPRIVAQETQTVKKTLIRVVRIAGGDILAQRLEVQLHPVIPDVGQPVRSARRDVGLVPRPEIGPHGEIQVPVIPAEIEGRGPRHQDVIHPVADAADRRRLAPLGRVDRAVNGWRLAHLGHGQGRNFLRRKGLVAHARERGKRKKSKQYEREHGSDRACHGLSPFFVVDRRNNYCRFWQLSRTRRAAARPGAYQECPRLAPSAH